MAKLRQIAELGHPVLRQRALPVDTFNTPEIADLVADMLATLHSNGVGLAAPQIYESYRVLIVAPKTMEPIVMLNPSFKPLGTEMQKDWERCLSIPGIRALVPRYQQIEVCYNDLQGIPHTCHLSDFTARIFQHEFDHLDGLVYIDRVEDNREIISEKEYLKLRDKN